MLKLNFDVGNGASGWAHISRKSDGSGWVIHYRATQGGSNGYQLVLIFLDQNGDHLHSHGFPPEHHDNSRKYTCHNPDARRATHLALLAGDADKHAGMVFFAQLNVLVDQVDKIWRKIKRNRTFRTSIIPAP